MSTQLKKIPSNLLVVYVGSISFQEISYASKPQVASRYIHECFLGVLVKKVPAEAWSKESLVRLYSIR